MSAGYAHGNTSSTLGGRLCGLAACGRAWNMRPLAPSWIRPLIWNVMNSELPRKRVLLSASPCMPISAHEIQSRLRLNLACILPGYARHSAAHRPTSSFVSPSPSQGGSSESERPHATYRALASPLRIRTRPTALSPLRYVSAAYPLRHCALRRRRPGPRASAPPDLRPA